MTIINKLTLKNNEFVAASSILIVLTSVFFIRSILFRLIPSPADILKIWPLFAQDNHRIQNLLMTDVVTQFEPWAYYNNVNIQSLQIPLWNPYCGGGVPHIANMQSMLFFPPAWPIYLFGMTGITLLLLYFIKIYLTGISSYYYLRSIKLAFYPSIIGAITFMFVGFNIVWLYWPHSNVIFILPLMLYAIEKYLENILNKNYLLLLTVAVALGIFAGHPETFFHIGVVSFLYFVFRLGLKKITVYEKIEIAKNYVLFTLLGVALSAVQLIPFLEYLINSYAWVTRSNPRYMLDWHTSILNLVPEFYGSPSIYHIIPYYISFTNYNETVGGYVGISIICFAILALITKFNYSIVRFYLLLDIWLIGVVYGVPFIFDFTVSLPLFSHAANHRMLFLIGFVTTVLGSIGLNELIERSKKENKKCLLFEFLTSTFLVVILLFYLNYNNILFLYTLSSLNEHIIKAQNILIIFNCILILSTLALAYIIVLYAHNHRVRTFGIICLMLLFFSETGIHGMLFEPAVEEKYFYPNIWPVEEVVQKNNLYRATSIDPFAGNVLGGSAYPVNTQMIYGIYDIRNYDALDVRYYRELFNIFAHGTLLGWIDLHSVDEQFLNFMGVKWIFSRSDLLKEIDIESVDNTNILVELKKGVLVEQTFRSQRTNLSKIELFYATYYKEFVDSNLKIELIEKKTNQTIRTAIFNSKVLKDNQWYPFEFEPIRNSYNKTYVLKISSDGSTGKSVTLWMNNASINDVLEGKLYINGSIIPGNLCIKTYFDKETSSISLIRRYPGYYIFENKGVIPRAFFVQNAIFRQNDSDILTILKNGSFDWKSSVVLYGKDKLVKSTKPNANFSVDIIEYQPTYIKIKVNTQAPGFLVISDTYYPGWVAYLNGNRTDILRANYAFRSVEVGGGESVIEFNYKPITFYIGASITIFALLIIIAISLRKHLIL